MVHGSVAAGEDDGRLDLQGFCARKKIGLTLDGFDISLKAAVAADMECHYSGLEDFIGQGQGNFQARCPGPRYRRNLT